ncbi:hypothetical protein [Roseibium sp.]|uniref:hypothetical protein n=1 Tax=Roseibium sp. TaxID=1936156 RepID=UPI003A97797E
MASRPTRPDNSLSLASWLLSAALAALCTVGVSDARAQSHQLRGLPDDPRANLPSARQQLDDNRTKQLNSFSVQRQLEQDRKRQEMQQLHDNAARCVETSPGSCPDVPAPSTPSVD